MQKLIAETRKAQQAWSARPVSQRLALLRALRHRIAKSADELAGHARRAQPRPQAEVLSAEVLPLAEAIRFLERKGESILKPQRPGRKGRPFWLAGAELELFREPLGIVLVVGPSNYPLFLPGVQAFQALAAGNAVLLKPGRAGRQTARALLALLREAGIPGDVFPVLDESPETVQSVIAAGVDKVIFTGSAETGKTVLRQLACTVTPSVMELSGCDAVFVLADADPDLAAAALVFGMSLNAGATCIAPRRAFVARQQLGAVEQRLCRLAAAAPRFLITSERCAAVSRVVREALGSGARILAGRLPEHNRMGPLILADAAPGMAVMQEDLMAPVLALTVVNSFEQALSFSEECPYALGATVFGSPGAARACARGIRAGVVVINDMIVPTADPRVPFGGTGLSGFGMTRGEQGLLECTRLKTVIVRKGAFRPHFQRPGRNDALLFSQYIKAAHAGSLVERGRAFLGVVRELCRRG